jgi:hypothetical protein
LIVIIGEKRKDDQGEISGEGDCERNLKEAGLYGCQWENLQDCGESVG